MYKISITYIVNGKVGQLVQDNILEKDTAIALRNKLIKECKKDGGKNYLEENDVYNGKIETVSDIFQHVQKRLGFVPYENTILPTYFQPCLGKECTID